jgi:hypothetical protein
MAAFHSELAMRMVSDSDNGGSGEWVLTAPLVYYGDVFAMVAVPEGFRTDLASVPRWAYYGLFGNVAHKAAVVHDFLIEEGYKREDCDAEFMAAMKASGVPAWRRWPMYAAVRLYSIFSGA